MIKNKIFGYFKLLIACLKEERDRLEAQSILNEFDRRALKCGGRIDHISRNDLKKRLEYNYRVTLR